MDPGDLEAAIAAQEGLRGSVPDAVVDVAIAALRTQATSVAEEQRRRLATVLFADLRGFTSMSESLDAEDLSELMNAVWARLDKVVVEHGGHIDKHIGDALMAIWGAGATREDDPEQAVRAALGLQDALAAFRQDRGIALEMRIGVNTGHVVLGSIGTTGEFTAMGDAVNLASRLEHEAPTSGVLLSQDTYRHIRGVFEVVERPPLAVRGKAEPVRTYLISAVKPRAFRTATRGVEGVDTKMVGRERELEVLQQAITSADELGTSRSVAVIGEPGAGKSRLLWEFENWLELRPEGVFFLAARSTPQRRPVHLGLLRDLVATRMEIVDTDSPTSLIEKLRRGSEGVLEPDEAILLGRWLGFDLGRSMSASALIDSERLALVGRAHLERFMRSCTDRATTVLLLEDLHWADDASIEVLNQLLRYLSATPLVAIWSARPIDSVGPVSRLLEASTSVELGRLRDADVESLLHQILQRVEHIPDDLIAALVNRAEGNAFYLEELVKMLIDRGSIGIGDEAWVVESDAANLANVPTTLTGVLQARVDALPHGARHSLALASVVGRTFWDQAVEHLATPERPMFEPALERELIFKQPTTRFDGSTEYVFKHALLHDVVSDMVLMRDRRLLHSRAAEWLERASGDRRDEFLVEIGEHHRLAGSHERAAEAFELAAQHVLAVGDPSGARQLGMLAVASYDAFDHPVPAALLIALSHAHRRLGDLERAQHDAVGAVAVARRVGSPTELAEALDAAAQAAFALGDGLAADELLGEATAVAEQVGGIVLGQILIQRAYAELQAGRDPGDLGQRILHLAQLSGGGPLVVRANIIASRIAEVRADYDALDAHLDVALAESRRSRDRLAEAITLNNIGATLQRRGEVEGSTEDFERAEVAFRQAIELCAELGLGEELAVNTMNLAEVRLALHDATDARHLIRRALAQAMEIQSNAVTLFGVIVYAELLLDAGDTVSARRLVDAVERHPGSDLIGYLVQEFRQRLPHPEFSVEARSTDDESLPDFADIVSSIIDGTEVP